MSLQAFVSGASGFVGSHLVRELHAQGWEVHVLARPTSNLNEIGDVPHQVHIGDVTDADSVHAGMPRGVDAVFHVAASTNFWSRNNDAQTRVNVDGTRNMLDAAIAAGAGRFVHTSSFVTWGFQDLVIDEDSKRVDSSDWINYVRTKHLSEQLVVAAADANRIDATVLNPANVLGPGDWHNWSRLFMMIDREKLPAAAPGGGSFCDVREVARAHVRAYHDGRRGERYLLGGEYATLLEVAGICGELLGRKTPKQAVPGWVFRAWAQLLTAVSAVTGREPEVTPEMAVMASHRLVCDSSRAQQELDYRFVPVRKMIEDTLEWMKERGLLQ